VAVSRGARPNVELNEAAARRYGERGMAAGPLRRIRGGPAHAGKGMVGAAGEETNATGRFSAGEDAARTDRGQGWPARYSNRTVRSETAGAKRVGITMCRAAR